MLLPSASKSLRVLMVVLLLAAVPAAANTVQWFNAVSGNWSDSTKWYDVQTATTHVPTATDDVQIIATGSSYTVTVDVTAVAGSLTFGAATGNFLVVANPLTVGTTATSAVQTGGILSVSGGTLTLSGTTNVNGGTINFGSGTLKIDGTTTLSAGGTLNWSNGGLTGAGTLVTAPGGASAPGVINILTTATRSMTSLTIDNNGTTTWSAGTVQLGNGATFNNKSGATFDAQSDDSMPYNIGGASPTFNNSGTFQKSGGTAITSLGFAFNNQTGGSLLVPTGTVQLANGGTFDPATVTVGSSQLLEFANGTFTFNNGASINGPAQLTTGTLFFAAGIENFDQLVMNNGFIDGPGTLTINSTMTWNAGTWQGTGSVDIGASSSLSIASAGTHVLSARTLNNSGNTTYSAGQIFSGAGAVIANQAGGTFDLSADVSILYNIGGVQTIFDNFGSVTKNGGAGTSTIGADFRLESGASLTSTSGTLSLTGGGTLASSTVASGGVIDLNGGTFTLNNGAAFSGPTTFTAGTVFVSTGVTASADDFTMNSGTLDGPGILNISFAMNWNGGAWAGTGSVDIAFPNGLLTIGTAAIRSWNTRTLNNGDTVHFTAGQISSGNGATINNAPGTTFDIQNDVSLLYNTGGAAPVFNNSGTLAKSGGAGTATVDMILNNQSGGAVNVSSGTLALRNGGTWVSGATVTGATLEFGGGTFTFSASTSISGPLHLTTGSILVSSAVALTVDALTMDNGTIDGAGILDINGTMNWNAGTFQGSGSTDVRVSTGTLILGTASTHTLSARTINNYNVVQLVGGAVNSGNGAVINNAAGATFDFQTDGNLFYNIGGAQPVFNNAGTVIKSGGAAVAGVAFAFNQQAGATLTVASGTLKLAAGGTFDAATTATTGILEFNGGTFTINNGSAFNGPTQLVSGTVLISAGATVPANAFDLNSGTLDGPGTLLVTGTMNWNGGVMQGAGTVDVQSASGTLNLATTATKTLNGRTINNSNTATWSAGQINSGLGGVFNDLAGSTFTITGDDGWFYNTGGAQPVFNNAGIVTKSGGAGTTNFAIPFNQSVGSTTAAVATLYLAAGGNQTGGSFDASAGAVLQLNGTHTMGAAVSVSGNGTISVIGGTTTVAGTYSVANLTSINGGRLDLNANGTSTTIDLIAGALGGTAVMSVTTMNWQGGSMDGGGTTDVATTLALTTIGTKTLNGRILNNQSSGTWAAGQINSGSGSVFNNPVGATFNIQGDDGWFYNTGGVAPVINNSGTFTKSATTGTTNIAVTYNQSGGTTSVTSGTLYLSAGGTHTGGLFTNAAGTTLQFNSTHTMGAAVTINSPGTISVIGGTTTVNGTMSVTGLTSINGGRLDLNTNTTSNVVDLINGSLGGTATLTTPTFNWQSGTMDGGGTTSVTSLLSLTTIGTKTLNGRVINNSNTTTWTAGQINSGNGSVFNNPAGATFDIQGDDGWFFNTGGSAPVFNNSGTFTKTAGPGTTNIGIAYNQSAGTTSVGSGTLYLSLGGTHTGGTFSNVAGTTLQFNSTHTMGASVTINSPGTLSIIGGTTTVAGTYNVTGLTSLNGGRLDLNSNGSSTTFDFISGSLGGTGTLTAPTFNWQSGTMDGGGTTNVSTTLSLSTIGTKTLNGRTINNSGAASWSAGQINSGNGSVFNNLAGATFDMQGDDGWFFNTGGSTPIFNNAGTLKKSGGTVTSTLGIQVDNSGIVQALSGTLLISSYTQTAGTTTLGPGSLQFTAGANFTGGILNGTGTITGNVTNAAQVNPGTSPGMISISGNYTQTSAGMLNIELAGTTAGTQFDQLNVSGTAALAGTLNVALISPYSPLNGDAYAIVTAGTLTGTFGTTNGLSLGGGRQLTPNYSATTLTLVASGAQTNNAAVDFSPITNPNGVWSYGWTPTLGGAFTLMNTAGTAGGADVWSRNGAEPVVFHNPTASPITFASWTLPAGKLGLHPGSAGEDSVVRWTAPSAGTFRINGFFNGIDFSYPTTTDVSILQNGAAIFSGNIASYNSPLNFSVARSIAAGDRIDFVVGYGSDGNYSGDATQLEASIVAVGSADLSLTKTDSADPVIIGTPFTYTLTAANAGPSPATSVVVTDTLPAGLAFVSATPSQGTCSGTATITCSLGTIASAANATIAIVVQGTTATTVTNTASASLNEFDPNTANNSASQSTTISPAPQADLSLTMTDAPDPVSAGATITYTITATNAGPGAASSVVVSDVLPAGSTFVSATGTGWTCNFSAGTVTCTMPSLAVSTAAPITLQISAPVSGSSVSNTATISSATTDPVAANNSATATTTISAVADLSLLKSGPPSANAGSTISWTITPTNSGPSTASSVTITDTLPAGTTFVSATGTGWSCANASGTVTCTAGTLVVGTGPAITLQATAPANPGPITNTATISATSTDPTPGNNSASAATNVAAVADLSISMSDSPDPVVIGSPLTYTLVVQNLGPSSVGGATVTDTLPAGTAFVSASGATWSCGFASGIVTCTHGALPAGSAPAITITINAPAVAGTMTNSASVSLLTSDPNSSNNTASVSTTVTAVSLQSDLTLSVSGPAAASVGESIAYTIAVGNNGPDDASSVIVNVSFSTGLQFDTKDGAGWICKRLDELHFRCELATLSSNSAPLLVFNMTPTVPGTVQFFANVGSGNSDPNGSNNSGSASTVVSGASAPNLVLTKASSVASIPADGAFSYTFAVANTGNLDATSLVLTDPLPASLTLLSIDNGDWSCSYVAGNPLTCTLSTLAAGASSSFSIHVQAPPQPGEVTNSASVSSAETDADASDNASTAVTTIGCPLFNEIPLLSAPRTINSGQHYTITLNQVTHATAYEVQESQDEQFTSPTTIQTGELTLEFVHDVLQVTRFYYRARVAKTDCGDSGPFSDPIPVTVEPFSATNPNPSIAVEFGDEDPVEQTIFISQPPTGETHFEATTDRPWMTVSPSSGPIGAAGVLLTVTADPSQLDVGTNTGTVILSFSNSAKRSPAATPAKSTIPVSVSLVTPVIMQPPTGPTAATLFIPAVAHVDTPNARWQSDVRLTNAGSSTLSYVLSFVSTGGASTATLPQTTLQVRPGQSVALNDIVRNWFGLGALSDGVAGVLQIRPVDAAGKMSPHDLSVATVAASRTFSIGSNGTSGQFVPAIRFSSFIGSSSGATHPVLNLQQLGQSSLFRTNLGLVEGSGQPANVAVRVFDSLGNALASIPVSLKANEHMQINSFLEKNHISLQDGRIEVQVTSGTGRVTTYASVVDNGTNDPLFESGIPLSNEAAGDYMIGGVGDFTNDVNHWRTDMRLFNPTSTAVTATMTYYPEANPGAAQSKQISLAPGEMRAYDNILETQFGIKNSVGVVRVTPSLASPLVATARTYDKQAGGTFGQFVPAVTAEQSVGLQDRALQILQVEESDRFRTNLGIFEVTGKPAKVEVGIVAPELAAAAFYSVQLQGYEFRNLGSLLKVLGLPSTYNGRLTVRVIEGEGRVSAYASVIDLKTQDPTYVPAQ